MSGWSQDVGWTWGWYLSHNPLGRLFQKSLLNCIGAFSSFQSGQCFPSIFFLNWLTSLAYSKLVLYKISTKHSWEMSQVKMHRKYFYEKSWWGNTTQLDMQWKKRSTAGENFLQGRPCSRCMPSVFWPLKQISECTFKMCWPAHYFSYFIKSDCCSRSITLKIEIFHHKMEKVVSIV